MDYAAAKSSRNVMLGTNIVNARVGESTTDKEEDGRISLRGVVEEEERWQPRKKKNTAAF